MTDRQYDDTNRFVLFPNSQMRHGHRDPDLSGFINIDGKEYWFKGWTSYNDDDTVKCINGTIGDEREIREKSAPATKKAAPRRGPSAPSKSTRR